MLGFGPGRSLAWGYAAAAGIGVQALFSFDGKWTVRSAVHVAGFIAFGAGVMQHSVQSNFWLGLPRGSPAVEVPAALAAVLKFRRNVAEYGPLVVMLGPLSSQMLSNSQMSSRGQRNSGRSIWQDSGMPKAMGLTQWALLLMAGAFYVTFACDFWYASQHY